MLGYHDPKSKVRWVADISKPLGVSDGVHQGSGLSTLLFIFVMGIATRDIQRPMLYADEVFLSSHRILSYPTNNRNLPQ